MRLFDVYEDCNIFPSFKLLAKQNEGLTLLSGNTHQWQIFDGGRIAQKLLQNYEESDHEDDISGERNVTQEFDVADHHQGN